MRYLPAILARLYQPVFGMDTTHDRATEITDPIAHELQVAVERHERVGEETRCAYRSGLDEMLDDLFSKLDAVKDDKRG